MFPKFIVLEGIDGSGKSTQLELLIKWFQAKKITTVITKEPTQGEWGQKIRKFISSPDLKGESPERIQILYILDRKEDIEKNIQPALQNNKVVLAERYFLSTLAYGEASGISWKRLWDLHKQLIGQDFPQPDITFLLDIDPMVAFEHLQKTGESLDYFETLERLRKIRGAYLHLSKNFKNIHIINTELKSEKIHEQIIKILAN